MSEMWNQCELGNKQMNVENLIKILQSCPSDMEVVIVTRERTLGPTPSTRVSNACRGFDWDTGKLLLFPEDNLIKENSK